MGKWITLAAAEVQKGTRTLRWKVLTLEGALLGHVQWFARWRGYAFFPDAETVFEETCLRDLADFCEQATRDHVEARRRRREAWSPTP